MIFPKIQRQFSLFKILQQITQEQQRNILLRLKATDNIKFRKRGSKFPGKNLAQPLLISKRSISWRHLGQFRPIVTRNFLKLCFQKPCQTLYGNWLTSLQILHLTTEPTSSISPFGMIWFSSSVFIKIFSIL